MTRRRRNADTDIFPCSAAARSSAASDGVNLAEIITSMRSGVRLGAQ